VFSSSHFSNAGTHRIAYSDAYNGAHFAAKQDADRTTHALTYPRAEPAAHHQSDLNTYDTTDGGNFESSDTFLL
jgi:hypothetical protein